jgi:hypothetical protein
MINCSLIFIPIFPMKGQVWLDIDIQFQVPRVNPKRRSRHRKFKIYVITDESVTPSLPEKPDGVELVRLMQNQKAIRVP